jgi:hypothetical protein
MGFKSMMRLALVAAILMSIASNCFATSTNQPPSAVIKIVRQIQKADYEGDRSALERLYGELQPFLKNKELASRVHYWRAFALWRRALNGANESVATQELDTDLAKAVEEFRQSANDTAFVDAKIALASCLLFRVFLNQADSKRVQTLLPEALDYLKQAQNVAPENPRLLWVLGSNAWYLPPERGGGQSKAISTYLRGLQAATPKPSKPVDPLDPTWGEPELLMSLAWSNLHKSEPDLDAAERYAHSALTIVPYWHYVRDLLLPQIRASRTTR